MRMGLRVLGGLLGLIAVALLALTAFVFFSARPQVAGTAELRGLSGPVTVTRDRWGVPHIRAQASDADALFALGYVHAQDRLWQMEFQRRVARGQLSEVLGGAALEQDKFLRTWGFYRAAEAALPALSARTRTLLSAYTAGVNAAISQGKLPLEFRVLGFRPGRWTDVDSLAWQKLMAFDLGGNWEQELNARRIVDRLGAGELNTLYPPYPAGSAHHPERAGFEGAGRKGAGYGGRPLPHHPSSSLQSGRPDRQPGLCARPRQGEQRLGGLGPPHKKRQAAAGRRPAPRPSGADAVVPGRPARPDAARYRRDHSGLAGRGDRAQRPRRLGRHQHRAGRAGPVPGAAGKRLERAHGNHQGKGAARRAPDRARKPPRPDYHGDGRRERAERGAALDGPRSRRHHAGRLFRDQLRAELDRLHERSETLCHPHAKLRVRRRGRQHRLLRAGARAHPARLERRAAGRRGRGARVGRLRPLRGAAARLQPAGGPDRDGQQQGGAGRLPVPADQPGRLGAAVPRRAHSGIAEGGKLA